MDKVQEIVELSQKELYRPEIARRAGVSEATVYKYQKIFDLV